jgi:23S rRNA (uridine2552-2'-O)-methyltransferase
MAQTKSSKRWLAEHRSDPYVRRAKEEGLRARSAYKLLEIQKIYKLLRPGMLVVDLGAAPGSWSEIAVRCVKPNGQVFALDILPIQPLVGVTFLQGDFTDSEVFASLEQLLDGQKVDVVLSDMAPNLSGIADLDQARSLELAEAALKFTLKTLKADGTFLLKVFQGHDFQGFLKKMRDNFQEVKSIKPEASRSRSKEIFLLAKKAKSH